MEREQEQSSPQGFVEMSGEARSRAAVGGPRGAGEKKPLESLRTQSQHGKTAPLGDSDA